jgi:hypothetical protein
MNGDNQKSTEGEALSLDERKFRFEKKKFRAERADKRRDRWTSPLVLSIVAGVLALIGNGHVAYENGRQSNTKALADIEVEKAKDDANLVIEALKTGDTAAAAENLRLLARAQDVAVPVHHGVVEEVAHIRPMQRSPLPWP